MLAAILDVKVRKRKRNQRSKGCTQQDSADVKRSSSKESRCDGRYEKLKREAVLSSSSRLNRETNETYIGIDRRFPILVRFRHRLQDRLVR